MQSYRAFRDSYFPGVKVGKKISKIRSCSGEEQSDSDESEESEENDSNVNEAILSPSEPGFFSPPSSTKLTVTHSPIITPPHSPSSSLSIPCPSSPLRISSVEQEYEDVTATPMLYCPRLLYSVPTKSSAATPSKEIEKKPYSNSISAWLMKFVEDDEIPVADDFSTLQKNLAPQPSLDHLREFAHHSPYPRPLYASGKENLDENCINHLDSNENKPLTKKKRKKAQSASSASASSSSSSSSSTSSTSSKQISSSTESSNDPMQTSTKSKFKDSRKCKKRMKYTSRVQFKNDTKSSSQYHSQACIRSSTDCSTISLSCHKMTNKKTMEMERTIKEKENKKSDYAEKEDLRDDQNEKSNQSSCRYYHQRKSKTEFMINLPSILDSWIDDSVLSEDEKDLFMPESGQNNFQGEDSSSQSFCASEDEDKEKELFKQESSESTETEKDFQHSLCHPLKKKRKTIIENDPSQMQKSKSRKVSVLVNESNISIIKEKLESLENDENTINDSISFEQENAHALDLKDIYGKINTSTLEPLPDDSNSTTPMITTPRYAYDTPTKFETVLRSHSKEELQQYTEKGLPYCDETVKTHKWVYGMFLDYCKAAKKEPFPLKAKPVYGFVKLLGIAVGYSIGTITHGIKSSLYNISETRTGKPVKDKVKAKFHRAILEIKAWYRKRKMKGFPLPKMRKENEKKWKKQPLIVTDLQRARAHTCAHVRLKDIIRVYSPPNSNFIKVTFNLECGKGWNGDNHCVTVEGAINEKHQLNVIWWLEQYLVEEFGLSLTNFDKWELKELEEQFIWQLRKGAMRVRLKKRAVQAGYPDNLFGFHSFRSGFICSALLKAGENQEKRKQALEATAFVGNWILISKSQWEYVKETEKAVIIGNRLGFPDETVEDDVYYDMALTSPQVYHNIKLNEPIWKKESIILTFDFFVLEILKATCSELYSPNRI
ncbi:uncharacterized protein MONOS_13303 [Monocercomonoides exilis]|uniref:uncharacterized protein n=1 Tax=Monocercomonoides exilis TaxID=2049356 RepID=UPI003559C0DC|nr:hypothetical protein MONOS_13303 [Monocercomonoides exilis]|eukprot:MONOS_13303.1-p1 / transcript=MONOS_13303.1 / gene=MONOS_13303 / organism=Monocercomonoides_exilis_PA203 / gene_product=unspecified product / transcript_product=unspecified product / location=Mono_scaffold00806:2639-5668(-) / protein_length=944 / sequence_SO=supercontig / SO=protein_coding / is_pseudo=false